MPSNADATAQPSRAEVVARAAIEVLGNEGSRGLTHRAVDRRANLPEGSTGNLYGTRAELLAAINDALAEANIASAAELAPPGEGLALETLADFMAEVVELWAEGEPVATRARFEFYLLAKSYPETAGSLAKARLAFRETLAASLRRLGVSGAESKANATLSFMDGLVLNQMVQPASKMTRGEIRDSLGRWFLALRQESHVLDQNGAG